MEPRVRVIHANNDATPRVLACVQGGVLPLDLLLEDEFGSRGGAESAFMSTSTNLTEAAKYATRGVSLASAILPPNSVAVFRESGGKELRGPSGKRRVLCRLRSQRQAAHAPSAASLKRAGVAGEPSAAGNRARAGALSC